MNENEKKHVFNILESIDLIIQQNDQILMSTDRKNLKARNQEIISKAKKHISNKTSNLSKKG
ncbi:hypothetical protein IHV09_22165 [Fictibacillus sp. 23RED33]|uniref:hypothetical protein n=1 Tax=Fictibacillus sp. 23RED33 TaxID=2745879 RepID=UPI0018CE4871|nr:hypothetical protein [Fictibacillus sp. 23RED33]MBH0176266.1 hypothetical protein [Fictibacillus sp. 23RED33]